VNARGVLAVAAAAVALGGGVLLLQRLGGPEIELPGPCEVVRTLPEMPSGMPDMPPERIIHRYDASGRKLLEQRMLGTHPSQSTRWEHDEAGRVVLEERFTPGPIHHQDVDGTRRVLDFSRSRLRFTYDAAGRMLTRAYEPEGDGVVQHLTRYFYDEAGRPKLGHAEWEGKYASDTTYEHDAEGRLVGEQSDGGAEAIRRYEHDAHGRVIQETEDYLADGSIDRTVTRRFDDAGLLLSELVDEGLMGTRMIEYTYDAAGNVLTRHERPVSEIGAGMAVLDTHDYRCWVLRDGVPMDERPSPEP
jgi:YD repeat-containing protein